jgi:uncharacterized protein YgiM (DUF1202 family)
MTSYDKWVVDQDNKELQEQVEADWKMFYSVKYGGKEGRIKSVNRTTAESQFQWIVQNKDCFCRTCTHQYLKDFSVYMDTYDHHCVHKEEEVTNEEETIQKRWYAVRWRK